MQYTLNVSVTYRMFLIGNFVDDDDFIEETYDIVQEYIDEGLDDMLYYSKGRLVVGTIGDIVVPVTIDILPEKPDPDTIAAWINHANQVGVCGFQVFSDTVGLEVHSIQEFDLKRGNYEVMIFYNDLDKQYDPVTGDDWYHIVFYPGELSDTRVIKTYIPLPPRYKPRD